MGRKKSKARQKRINSNDVQIEFPNDGSESTFTFASKPASPFRKLYVQGHACPIRCPKITSIAGIPEECFPELPILSSSMQELYLYDAESFLTSDREVASCDDLPLTSTLTPLPSSLELRELEADALRMDSCCSFRLDSIVFKDSVPCLGNRLQEDMAKVLYSLHPKTAFSFRSKIYDLSRTIDHTISTYNSVCRNAAVRIDMLSAEESLLIEKTKSQRSQIEELEKKIEKLTELASEDNPGTSAKINKQHAELDQKNVLTTKETSLTEKVSMQQPQIQELENRTENLTELASDDNPEASAKINKQHADLDQDMLAAKESFLTEKVFMKRSKIEDIIKQTENLTELTSDDNPGASAKINKQHAELDQKDMLAAKETSLTKKVSMQQPQIQELENKAENLTELTSDDYPGASAKINKQHAVLDQKNMLTTIETSPTEKVFMQQPQIQELENRPENLTELASDDNPGASAKINKQHAELDQKDMLAAKESLITEKVFMNRLKIEDIIKKTENLMELVSDDNPGASAKINKQHAESDQKNMLTPNETSLTEKVSMQQPQIQELENRTEKQTQLVSEAKPCASDNFEKQHAELDQNGVSTTKESLLTKKVFRQRSQIEELENESEKPTELISETNARASNKFEMHRVELDQEDKIIRLFEEKTFIANKLIEQNFKLDEGDKIIISIEEAESQKVDGFKKHCFEQKEKNKTIQNLREAVSLEVSKLDTDITSESQQNLETEVFSTKCENLIAERKTEAETDINEFDQILELGRLLSKNMRSILKAKEIGSIQNKTKSSNMTVDNQKISRQDVFAELKSLKSQIASLTEQLHSKTQILSSLNSDHSSLRNEILFKSARTQESEKSIENGNDDFKRLDMLILSLQEKNKALKQNSTQLKYEISNSKISRYLRENLPLSRDRCGEMKVQKMNLLKNNETQQVLHKTENNSSSHFSSTEENKENFEFGSNFMKNADLNNILIHHTDDSERNINAANSLHKDIQNLLDIIEVQELLKQQSTFVRKLVQEISSIKQENSCLSERVKTNETKLALIEVEFGLTSSGSSTGECDASMQKFEDTDVKME